MSVVIADPEPPPPVPLSPQVLTGHFRHREALVKRHDIIPDVPADRRVSLPFVLGLSLSRSLSASL